MQEKLEKIHFKLLGFRLQFLILLTPSFLYRLCTNLTQNMYSHYSGQGMLAYL